MNKYLVLVILVLLGVIGFGWYQLDSVNNKWETAEANIKQYDSQLGYERKKGMALQLNIDQLKYFNDSILKALDDTRKKLDIKDKNLKALQAISSSFSKKDTILITQVDTLFKEPTLAIDTLMGDEWYTLRLGLQYPSMIAVKPEFKSEKQVIVSTKKETVNPPKKFFLFRWFQRKHRVLHVDVVEKNPYVQDASSEYIEIMR